MRIQALSLSLTLVFGLLSQANALERVSYNIVRADCVVERSSGNRVSEDCTQARGTAIVFEMISENEIRIQEINSAGGVIDSKYLKESRFASENGRGLLVSEGKFESRYPGLSYRYFSSVNGRTSEQLEVKLFSQIEGSNQNTSILILSGFTFGSPEGQFYRTYVLQK